jgi:hypothetical protein
MCRLGCLVFFLVQDPVNCRLYRHSQVEALRASLLGVPVFSRRRSQVFLLLLATCPHPLLAICRLYRHSLLGVPVFSRRRSQVFLLLLAICRLYRHSQVKALPTSLLGGPVFSRRRSQVFQPLLAICPHPNLVVHQVQDPVNCRLYRHSQVKVRPTSLLGLPVFSRRHNQVFLPLLAICPHPSLVVHQVQNPVRRHLGALAYLLVQDPVNCLLYRHRQAEALRTSPLGFLVFSRRHNQVFLLLLAIRPHPSLVVHQVQDPVRRHRYLPNPVKVLLFNRLGTPVIAGLHNQVFLRLLVICRLGCLAFLLVQDPVNCLLCRHITLKALRTSLPGFPVFSRRHNQVFLLLLAICPHPSLVVHQVQNPVRRRRYLPNPARVRLPHPLLRLVHLRLAATRRIQMECQTVPQDWKWPLLSSANKQGSLLEATAK